MNMRNQTEHTVVSDLVKRRTLANQEGEGERGGIHTAELFHRAETITLPVAQYSSCLQSIWLLEFLLILKSHQPIHRLPVAILPTSHEVTHKNPTQRKHLLYRDIRSRAQIHTGVKPTLTAAGCLMQRRFGGHAALRKPGAAGADVVRGTNSRWSVERRRGNR